jgi:agmatinase
MAPATGTPESGGLLTRELKYILRGLNGYDIVGMDVVEGMFNDKEVDDLAHGS